MDQNWEDPSTQRAKQALADQEKLLERQKALSRKRMGHLDDMRAKQNEIWE